MKYAHLHPEEQRRLEALTELKIMDSPSEDDFDEIARLASNMCETPIALISFIEKERQWFKSKVGTEQSEAPRLSSFCSYTLLGIDAFEVENTAHDERFIDAPLVTESPYIRFYAGVPVMSPDGLPVGTLCVIDMQERKLTSSQLRSLKSLSNMVTRLLELKIKARELEICEKMLILKSNAAEHMAEAIVLHDANGSIVDFNSAAQSMLGLGMDEFTEAPTVSSRWEMIREDGSVIPAHQHPAMLCLQTGSSQRDVVLGVRGAEPELQWLKVSSVPLFRKPGSPVSHVFSSFTDITPLKTSKARAAKKQKEFRFILDAIPHMIGHWDVNLMNLNANHAYANYLGKAPEDLQGKHMKELLGSEFFESNLRYIQTALSGQQINFELTNPYRDGANHELMASYMPSFADGKVTGFLSIFMNVTELKGLEISRRHLEAQLAESSRLAALGEMAGSVAHEINNPLAIIRGKVGILKRRFQEERIEKEAGLRDLQNVEATVDRITKIIKGIRSYSRNAEHDEFETVDVRSIIDDTIELCSEKFRTQLVRVNVLCNSEFKIECRPAQISQVLVNLLLNSFDAITPLEQRWIEVEVSEQESTILILVRDSGNGIPQTVVEKLKQPFFSTKPVGKGTGLGLSISNRIAEGHGGSLSYLPGNKNTTFALRLPKAQTSSKRQAS